MPPIVLVESPTEHAISADHGLIKRPSNVGSGIEMQPDQPVDETDEEEEAFLDIHKPIMPQVVRARWTKKHYLKQVHKARYLSRPAVLFDQRIPELLTRTPWYVVLIFWVPIVLATGLKGRSGLQTWTQFGLLWTAGLAAWTLIEYLFHRCLFHIDFLLPDHQVFLTIHFLMHGFHHFLPMDRYRLVMPPILMSFLCAPFYFVLMKLAFPDATRNALFSGIITGYICYDLAHYHFHHAKPVGAHFRHMKKIHLAHHYGPSIEKARDGEGSSKAEAAAAATGEVKAGGFGVTSELWDRVFGTRQMLRLASHRKPTPS